MAPQSASLYQLLRNHDWFEAQRRCELLPEEANHVDMKYGWTPLHLACHLGSSPSNLVRTIAAAYPKAVTTKDRRFGDTPLHIQCRNSQRSMSKVSILLSYCEDDNAALLNKIGHTPLHTACCSNSLIQVLSALVDKNPAALSFVDYQCETPLMALWQTYIQSIPGHLTVARILKGERFKKGDSFERFWGKVRFLALQRHRALSGADNVAESELGHAILTGFGPEKLLLVALRLDPSLASTLDRQGNTMLHVMVGHRSDIARRNPNLVKLVLSQNPTAAKTRNQDGQTPLNVALACGLDWDHGVADVLRAHPAMLQQSDSHTQLLPFMQAAAHQCDLNTIYMLLTSQPDVLNH